MTAKRSMMTDKRFFAILAAMTQDDFGLVSGWMTLECWPTDGVRFLKEDGATALWHGASVSYSETPLTLYVDPVPEKAGPFTVTLKGDMDDAFNRPTDYLTGRAVLLDLDVDADNDGAIGEADDLLEEKPGGILATGTVKQVALRLAPAGLTGTLKLLAVSGGSHIRLWRDAGKTSSLALSDAEWDLSGGYTFPTALYVEGIDASAAVRDVHLCLRYTAAEDQYVDDDIRLTILKVELDSVSSADFVGNEASGTKVYAAAKESGNVVIQLKSSPSGVSLPSGFVSWSGGSVGSDQLQRSVSKSSLIEAGEDVVATVCGSDVFHGRVYVFKGPPVASGVDIDTTVTRDDSMAKPFGRTDRSEAWSPSETYDVYYENAEWGFVLEKVAYEIKWGINNGGRTDVPDGTANPFPPLGKGMPPGSTEVQKKTQAKSDLTPGATGRAPRTLYWASALTAQHEQFHVSDWRDNYYNPKAQEAETWIESQKDTVTLSKLIPVDVLNAKKSAFHDKLIEKTDEAQAAYSQDKEMRAYADGKDEYEALANSIVP